MQSVWPDLRGQTATGPQDRVGLARWQDRQFQPGTLPITGKHRCKRRYQAPTITRSAQPNIPGLQMIMFCAVLGTRRPKLNTAKLDGRR